MANAMATAMATRVVVGRKRQTRRNVGGGASGTVEKTIRTVAVRGMISVGVKSLPSLLDATRHRRVLLRIRNPIRNERVDAPL
jgi:hypothetical protein